MTYQTQMEAARQGIITKEMEQVAQKESLEPEQLRVLVAAGQIVIPANRNHLSLAPQGIGKGLRTKINVNIGVSRDCFDFAGELEKVPGSTSVPALVNGNRPSVLCSTPLMSYVNSCF